MKPDRSITDTKQTAATQHPESFDVSPARAEELLRAIIRGTSSVTGAEFFRSLVKHLDFRARNSVSSSTGRST
jgi:hypothetical protein